MSKKREKFIRLAEKRANKALHAIRLVGNLSNRNFYQYEESEVKQLTKALEAELTIMKRRFADETNKKGNTFTLN